MWPEGKGSCNKLFLRRDPALAAENQISVFLELGGKRDNGISLVFLIRKSELQSGMFLEYFWEDLTDFS